MKPQNTLRYLICFALILQTAGAPLALGQANTTVAQTGAAPAAAPDKPPLKPQELEQMLAPIALYPDSLLSQVFMASTYPLEVVQADRWAKANKALKEDAMAKELEKQDWDPSVKSLVNFPEVLNMMSEKLDLTMKLGDAFIAQQADVMNTVQVLRAKAQKEGNLKANEQQKVTVEAAPAPQPQTTIVVQQVPAPVQVIKIEPVSPQVIYVPTYNPVVVYGAWPYPTYPPYPYYPPRPPGYIATAAISFGVGVACGAAWGYAWGNCNWGRNNVDIDINRNININNANINRAKYQNNFQGNGNGNWQHNPAHRQGVPYNNKAAAQRYGGANQSAQAAQARDAYRGRTNAGQQDLARGGASDYRSNAGAGRSGANGGASNLPAGGVQNRGGAAVQDRAGTGAQNRGGAAVQDRAGTGAQNRGGAAAQDRAGAGAQNRPAASPANRPSAGDSGAFGGIDRGGSGARAESQRGQASRSSAGTARPSPSRSAGGGGGGGGGGRR